MASGTYSIVAQAQTVATAITILELTAPATGALQILRAWCQQSSSTTSAMARIEILRKTGTITGTATPPTPRPVEVGMPASGMTVKWIATAEGTDGVILLEEDWNLLNGWLYLPVPDERIWVPPSGIIALKFVAAPTSAAYSFGMNVRELG
jgi:hypothetical protein